MRVERAGRSDNPDAGQEHSPSPKNADKGKGAHLVTRPDSGHASAEYSELSQVAKEITPLTSGCSSVRTPFCSADPNFPGRGIGSSTVRRPVIRRQASAKWRTSSISGPATVTRRPRGAPSATSATAHAVSTLAMLCSRTRGTGVRYQRAASAKNVAINPWNWVERRSEEHTSE